MRTRDNRFFINVKLNASLKLSYKLSLPDYNEMQALYDWLIVNLMIKIVINWNSQFLLKLYKKKTIENLKSVKLSVYKSDRRIFFD